MLHLYSSGGQKHNSVLIMMILYDVALRLVDVNTGNKP